MELPKYKPSLFPLPAPMSSHSTAPNLIRHLIPLEFSKQLLDHRGDTRGFIHKQIIRASNEFNKLEMFRNSKLKSQLQHPTDLASKPFKLIFKNKSSEKFRAKKQIHVQVLTQRIQTGHRKQRFLSQQEQQTYRRLYDTNLEKKFVFKFVGPQKPISVFSANRAKDQKTITLQTKNEEQQGYWPHRSSDIEMGVDRTRSSGSFAQTQQHFRERATRNVLSVHGRTARKSESEGAELEGVVVLKKRPTLREVISSIDLE